MVHHNVSNARVWMGEFCKSQVDNGQFSKTTPFLIPWLISELILQTLVAKATLESIYVSQPSRLMAIHNAHQQSKRDWSFKILTRVTNVAVICYT